MQAGKKSSGNCASRSTCIASPPSAEAAYFPQAASLVNDGSRERALVGPKFDKNVENYIGQ
jgi:hypothetical protein